MSLWEAIKIWLGGPLPAVMYQDGYEWLEKSHQHHVEKLNRQMERKDRVLQQYMENPDFAERLEAQVEKQAAVIVKQQELIEQLAQFAPGGVKHGPGKTSQEQGQDAQCEGGLRARSADTPG